MILGCFLFPALVAAADSAHQPLQLWVKPASPCFKFPSSLLHSHGSHFKGLCICPQWMLKPWSPSLAWAPASGSEPYCPVDHMNPASSVSHSVSQSVSQSVGRSVPVLQWKGHAASATVGEHILNRWQITEEDPSGWSIRLILPRPCGCRAEASKKISCWHFLKICHYCSFFFIIIIILMLLLLSRPLSLSLCGVCFPVDAQ